jgi:hypothetical protein
MFAESHGLANTLADNTLHKHDIGGLRHLGVHQIHHIFKGPREFASFHSALPQRTMATSYCTHAAFQPRSNDVPRFPCFLKLKQSRVFIDGP